jgi:hypothetical protein
MNKVSIIIPSLTSSNLMVVALRPTAKEDDTQISEPAELLCNQPMMISSCDGSENDGNDQARPRNLCLQNPSYRRRMRGGCEKNWEFLACFLESIDFIFFIYLLSIQLVCINYPG